MIKKFFLKIKNHIKTVLTIKESPSSIALGFTIGTAIAILPTFGLGAVIGLGLILIFKKLSKVSMMAAFAVWNAAVLIPIYTLSYTIGDLILKNQPGINFHFEYNEALYVYSIKFIIGNLILLVIISVLSYLIIYSLAKKYQRQYKKYVADPLEKNVIDPIEELI